MDMGKHACKVHEIRDTVPSSHIVTLVLVIEGNGWSVQY